jgi:hypothetical protein
MGQGDLLANDFPTITNTATGCTASQACIWPRQKLEPIYEWANTWPGSSTTPNKIFPYEPTTVENRDFYQEKASFNGTIGVGQGPKSRIVSPGDLFNSCTAGPGGNTNGVAYWATDEQKLYVCNPTNTWTLYYTPYTYPHPLTVPAVVPAPVRSIILSWTNNGGDGFTIQRKDGHCLVPGTFTDLIHVTNASHQDKESPFPYACYHVRATLAGAPDSVDSNDDGSYLPMKTAPLRGLRRR